MLKVYISSTYRDLKDHREAVIDFFHHLKDQFTVICMEGYVAEDKTPVQKCLDDVCNCDVYVLVLANRYGFIPDDPAGNPQRYSVTELEYSTAVKEGKKLLAFFADTAQSSFEGDSDPEGQLLEEKKQKLQQFKTRVRTKVLTHPEGFIAPFHLALQVAESMMQMALLKWKMEELRRYCCDRGTQFSDFLAFRCSSRFKTIFIKGEITDVAPNLVNRFAIFTLNLTMQDIVPISFNDFITTNDYEKWRTLFLVHMSNAYLQTHLPDPVTIENFIKQVDQLRKQPVVMQLQCLEQGIGKNEMDFLQKFLFEFYKACDGIDGNHYYFFVCVEEEQGRENLVDQKINEVINACQDAECYAHVLPRLEEANRLDIRKWLGSFITKDESRILDLFQLQFGKLAEKFTMLDGERNIRKFIQRLNDQDQEILDILS